MLAKAAVVAFFVYALLNLGRCGSDVEDCSDAGNQSLTCIENRANNGDAEAQYSMADRYLQEKATTSGPDEFKAVSWLMKAAENGHSEAQRRLGNAYLKGVGGLPKDLKKAEHWWIKSATAGNLEAQIRLGEEYYDAGILNILKFSALEKNGKESFKWFLKAAVTGNSYSQRRVGDEYERGVFVEQDLVLACTWFILAADGGDKRAMKYRDNVSSNLTLQQRQEAEQLAASWQKGQIIKH